MKLLTHNFLTSAIIKGVKTGYPLGIVASEVKVNEVDFNAAFVKGMLSKVDWNTLYGAAKTLGHGDDLPNEIGGDLDNEDFLKKVHHVMLEVEVVNGHLVCPETNRNFPIKNGIPNMLLKEDEVGATSS